MIEQAYFYKDHFTRIILPPAFYHQQHFFSSIVPSATYYHQQHLISIFILPSEFYQDHLTSSIFSPTILVIFLFSSAPAFYQQFFLPAAFFHHKRFTRNILQAAVLPSEIYQQYFTSSILRGAFQQQNFTRINILPAVFFTSSILPGSTF